MNVKQPAGASCFFFKRKWAYEYGCCTGRDCPLRSPPVTCCKPRRGTRSCTTTPPPRSCVCGPVATARKTAEHLALAAPPRRHGRLLDQPRAQWLLWLVVRLKGVFPVHPVTLLSGPRHRGSWWACVLPWVQCGCSCAAASKSETCVQGPPAQPEALATHSARSMADAACSRCCSPPLAKVPHMKPGRTGACCPWTCRSWGRATRGRR